MSSFESARSRRALPTILLILVVLVVAGVAALAYQYRARIESQPPQVRLTNANNIVGAAPFDIVVEDVGAGLKSVTATLSQGGTDHTLLAEDYARPVREKKITVMLAKLPGIKEGPAMLRVRARDDSLWHWFAGNETVFEKPITLDITPPRLELIADDRYINFGGVGAIVYRCTKDVVTTGVQVGDAFFPGFLGVVKGHPDYFFAFFAHPYNAPPEQRAVIVATDAGGNKGEMRLAYELKNVKYKKSTIAVSDSFFQNKVVPLLKDVSKRQGSVKEVFVAVDKGVRKENEDKITEVTKKATPRILWQGAFTQLSNSKVEANFADQRTYTYNGEAIDTAYHLGYDLSVTKNYPIEAANSGTVAFTGDLGLYGNAVIIDHGLGLFTLYGHMSQIAVKPGDAVTQRQVIGKTGETGFAGGDHLHFGVYLDGIAILPVEWWDAKWIDDNITPKLEGQGSKESAAAPPARHAAAHKRRR